MFRGFREAGLVAMRKARDEGVCLEDMRSAMAQVQPSAMREIYIDIPKVIFSSVWLPSTLHIELRCSKLASKIRGPIF